MKILLKIIKGIITIFLIAVLIIIIFQKVTNNKIAVGNIYIFEIASESMFPEYKIGDIIVVKKVDADRLKVGDDVTYVGEKNELSGLTITHRIVEKREENGKNYFITQGIANEVSDPEISEDNIYGKVVYHTILFSIVVRVMTNMVIYYLLFVTVGVSFAYEVISSFFVKEEEEE